MQFQVERLDKRHTGHWLWRYRLRIHNDHYQSKSSYKNFHQLRSWMIEQYGVSCERDSYEHTVIACKGHEFFEPLYCWHVDRDYPNTSYIYVKDDAVLSNITLKWV
jgi:hypothetical protein